MRILFTTTQTPVPLLADRYLSLDDVTYRFIGDQGPFSSTCEVPTFSLHFLAQNLLTPSVLLEWPSLDELTDELQREFYDYVAISFKVIDMHRLVPLIECIRAASPESKIILGGYGTLGLTEPRFAAAKDMVDHICWHGDGVRWMRELLGEPLNRPIKCHLPIETIRIPWLSKMAHMETQVGYMLSALGCDWKCEFCCTSAYAEGKTIDVMSSEEIFESMKWYYRTYPGLKDVFMMDEDMLIRKWKVEQIGKLIREDDEFGLQRMSYLAFGTMKAISQWDPEELLLNGVSIFWAGVESKFSYGRKKGEQDPLPLIQGLQDVGLEAQLSWIMGDDCQTKENVDEDIEDLLKFKPTTAQLTILSAFPGTVLYERLKKEGRTLEAEPGQFCAVGNNMNSLHFTHEERLALTQKTYRRIYETLGPSIMRQLDIYMNGYEYCSKSKHPLLNTQKKEFFRSRISMSSWLIPVAIASAPTETAKKAMEALMERRVALLGPLSKMQRGMSERAIREAEAEMERRTREPWPTIWDVKLKKYSYTADEEEPALVGACGSLRVLGSGCCG